jgi:hypothetical protein
VVEADRTALTSLGLDDETIDAVVAAARAEIERAAAETPADAGESGTES